MKFELNKYHNNIADWELVEDVIAVARKMGKGTLTVNEYQRHGKYYRGTFRKRFGSWFATLKKAGLEPLMGPRNTDEITDEALFKNLAGVWIKLGKQPRRKEMTYPLSRFSYGAYVRHFGSWRNALIKFVAYADATSPPNPLSDSRADTPHLPAASSAKEKGSGKYLLERDTRDVSLRLRFSVFLRDGFRCVACGKSPVDQKGIKLQCDHIEPWSKGGKTIFDNLRTLCAECNAGKGNMEENVRM